MEISELNRYPFRKFRPLFTALLVPDASSLPGKYRGAFVGPVWLKLGVKPALWITGLGGWWGKDIFQDGTAINIVLRDGNFSTRFPMELICGKSAFDERDGLALRYQKGNPFPWMFIVDEIRRIDEITLLGMSRTNIPGVCRFALPFVLQKL
ncbi:MAG TPA: hypothetical protein VK909_11155 [Anaerolineales bacterium]|nr:hypothetical protein [Anaerolineales bacterium]